MKKEDTRIGSFDNRSSSRIHFRFFTVSADPFKNRFLSVSADPLKKRKALNPGGRKAMGSGTGRSCLLARRMRGQGSHGGPGDEKALVPRTQG
jgi:hypothetical protein